MFNTRIINICLLTSLYSNVVFTFECLSNLPYNFKNIDSFTDNMCAQCLWFMAGSEGPWVNHSVSSKWTVIYNHTNQSSALLCTPDCEIFTYANLLNDKHWIRLQLKSEYYVNILLDCCEQARLCCSRILESTNHTRNNLNHNHCPPKWDGFACWNSSTPGLLNHQPCPGMTFIASGLTPTSCRREIASKQCQNNGTWHRIWSSYIRDNETIINSQEYTDYYKCSTPGATHKLHFSRVAAIFYGISAILAIIGLLVLFKYGSKVRLLLMSIHANFFASLILTCISTILVLVFIKERHYRLHSMIDKNPAWCRILICLQKASRLTNYCWMLNEGIALWQMIVTPFPKWKNMKKFYYVGWGLPILVMSIYSIIHLQPQFNTHCWSKTMGLWEYVYSVPPITIILINVCLLFHLTFVLFRKLSSSDNEIRSAVRASLFLVPIFGFQYLFYIVPFDPFESCSITLFCAHYALTVTEALQGAMVACIFCFFNSEVQENIRNQLKRRKMRRGYRTSIAQNLPVSRLQQETLQLTESSASDESRKSSN